MDSIKRNVKSLLQRLKHDNDGGESGSSEPVRPASEFQAAARHSTVKPEPAISPGPDAPPKQDSSERQLETAYEHLATSDPPADNLPVRPDANQRGIGEDPTGSKENEQPLSSRAVTGGRSDSTSVGQSAEHIQAPNGPVDSSPKSLLAPVAGDATPSASKGDGEHEKEDEQKKGTGNGNVTTIGDLPPIKPIVVAPGMSATSGPLEEFPEGLDTQ